MKLVFECMKEFFCEQHHIEPQESEEDHQQRDMDLIFNYLKLYPRSNSAHLIAVRNILSKEPERFE